MTDLFSPDAEREVLATLILHGRQALGALPPGLRNPAAFSPEHRGVARVLVALAERDVPPHPVQVREAALALSERAVAEEPECVAELALGALGDLAALPRFAEVVGDLFVRREIRDAAETVVRCAGDRSLAIDALVRERIGPLVTRAAPPQPTGDGMVDALETLDREASLGGMLPGIATGIPRLDEMLDGLCPERLIVLAARPGCGKTAFATWVAQHAADADEETYFVTLEQPIKQLQRRRLAIASRLDLREVVRRGDWGRHVGDITRFATALKAQPLTFDDRSDTATGIALAVQRHAALVTPPKLVIVDYLSWIKFEGKHDRHDLGVGSVTKALARLAKDAHCAVVLLVQINRGAVHDGKPRRPTASDLRDSGAIEQDADQVVLLWEPPVDGGPDIRGDAEVEFVVGKNRHGPCGSVRVEWHKPTNVYREVPRLARVA